MTTFREIVFGPEGIQYISKCLEEGLTLSKRVLESVKLEGGVVKTWLPENVTEEEARKFDEGGKLAIPNEQVPPFALEYEGKDVEIEPIPNMNFEMEEDIKSFLLGARNRVCLFEDRLASASDPWVATAKSRILTFGEEVYALLLRKDSNTAKGRETIREMATIYPPSLAILTSVPEELYFPFASDKIEIDQLGILAQRTERIIVGAYDSEGYLMWMRT